MPDFYSFYAAGAGLFVPHTGLGAGYSATAGVATTPAQLILQPFFIGADPVVVTGFAVDCIGGAGVSVQTGVYDVAPAPARDIYPRNLVAEANPINISGAGVFGSSGWVGGAANITLTNGLYYLATLIDVAGCTFRGPTTDAMDTSFWLGFDPATSYSPYGGFSVGWAGGTPFPAVYPAGSGRWNAASNNRIHVGIR